MKNLKKKLQTPFNQSFELFLLSYPIFHITFHHYPPMIYICHMVPFTKKCKDIVEKYYI
jgi:hypothetical protein